MEQVIYKIINLVNDKFYVGSTINKKVRFREHRKQLRGNRHHCKHLQASWNKYGEDKFAFNVAEVIPLGKSLADAEDVWLKAHHGKPYCYNSGSAAVAPWRGTPKEAHPRFGKPRTAEEKKLISDNLKAYYAENIANHPRTGKQHSEETKAKISAKVQAALAKGKGGKFVPSEETRQKMSESLKGNQSAKGYKRTDAEREAIRQRALGNQNWLGKTHSVESREKMGRAVIAVAPNGEEKNYATISFLRAETGLLPATINRALKSGAPLVKGPYKGWTFKYCHTNKTAVQ